ncbi:MAG: RidA family protein [Pseudomonadota bacterium]|nr:RidA family protein [Pseudomonadota bacterium]
MKKRVITPPDAPVIGPYSPAVAAGPFLFISGQIPLRAATGELVEGDIRAETTQVMENIATILAAADYSWADVVKTTIYLADLTDFATVNEVYGGYFAGDYPARVTVQAAALPRGARIEIDAVAFKVPPHMRTMA